MDKDPSSSKPGRSRGRPRKASKDDSREEKRAKGRLAQRTYMQRKQAENDKLRNRISSLEDAIEEMSDEFLKFGEHVVKSEEVPPGLRRSDMSERSETLDHLRDSTKRFLSIARVAEKVAGDDGEDDGEYERVRTGLLGVSAEAGPGPGFPKGVAGEASSSKSPFPMSSNVRNQTPVQMSTIFPQFNSASFPHLNMSQQIQPNTGRFSPRLGYGLLNTSPLRNTLPSLWTHYIISGPSSFALRLYTDTILLMFRALRGEVSIPGFIPSIARFRFKYETPDTFMSLAEGQLSRMSISDSDPSLETGAKPTQKYAAAFQNEASAGVGTDSSVVLFGPSHPVMSAPLRAKIHSAVNYEIGSMSEWLDPWNTQQYLLSRWGLRCSYVTASIPAERWTAVHSPTSKNFANDTMSPMLPETGLQDVHIWDAQNQQQGVDVGGFFEDVSFQRQAPSPPDFVFNSQPLAEKLIQEAVCFGEGPRFFKQHIDDAVQQFLGVLPSIN
ncbi:hypothetical protein ONS95_004521 [Cadophora gregata]|uniref:uncharacterized protein n=1 Tax=Cadophora gregata TaxID=51156 RepID=UPI0026DD921D|nr:uncharacterized protein ONS95_004521 [Cadophora gregata]KAK0105117.1 hypothetical protein ONS96_004519 [Cadophora gregata f. sp. sojae]KAK0106015.1 hypothetical protein ONS95_004521 [Cadophora gregata]